MSTSPEPQKKEHSSTYFVQDRANMQELTRVRLQDQLTTASLRGVLPETLDPTRFQSILDVGCGTGNWLIEFASTYSTAKTLVGIDISELMIESARSYAEEQQVSDRVQFQVGDALHTLEFASDSFDLVNLRFGMSYLRTWDWPDVLKEFLRVAKPEGVIRVTEANSVVESSSPTLTQLFELIPQASYRAGHFFAPEGNGVTREVVHLLQDSGVQHVQSHQYVISYKNGDAHWQLFMQDIEHTFSTVLPFLKKWIHVPDNYQGMYSQALRELQQPDAWAKAILLSAWGNKPAEETE